MKFPVLAAMVLSITLSPAAQEGKSMQHAKGSFEIKMTPAEATPFEKANNIARFTSDKTWHGDFEGTSQGEMMTGSTESTGSMAYVAIERMSGKLKGHEGNFVFAHRASMLKDGTASTLSIEVVPHSGTGALAGITGSLIISIDAQGKHTWTFDYSLPQ